MRKIIIIPGLLILGCFCLMAQPNKISITNDSLLLLPAFMPMPEVKPPGPPGTIIMGDPKDFQEIKMDFPMASGPYLPAWNSINDNTKECPAWLREAKFGFWVHFGPQALGMSGDWYARKMYLQGQTAYKNHIRDFGHPSITGYKDVLNIWNPQKSDPARYVKLFKGAGARFLFIQGVHHDNFDLWNSAYQPWNSVNIGPKRDFLREWATASKLAGMKYGVTFHHEYTWWWYESAFRCDTSGDQKGIPYDGILKKEDGKGKWWDGLDPRMLYGINLREYKGSDNFKSTPPKGIFSNHLEYAHWFANNWALRILDVIGKYDPDFIYTDGNDKQPFSGYKTGSGYKCDAAPRVIASYYNRALKKHGNLDVFSIVKFHPAGNKGIVTTFEGRYPKDIKTDQAWIGENAVGDWYWAPYFVYSPDAVIRFLLECVSRDGCYAVNIPMMPDGALEHECLNMLNEIGEWLKINGGGIYGSKAWIKFGEGKDDKIKTLPGGQLGKKQAEFEFGIEDFRFTVGKDGNLYAFCMTVPGASTQIVIKSLGKKSGLFQEKIKSVELLGYNGTLSWTHEDNGLRITCPADMHLKTAVCFKIVR